jgi:hypothetical protein
MAVDTNLFEHRFKFREFNDRVLAAIQFGKTPERCSRNGRCSYVSGLIAKGELTTDSAGLYVRVACEEYPSACELNLPLKS